MIGVDLGRKSAGLAFSPDGQLTFTLIQLSFSSESEFIEKLREEVDKKKEVAKVVFGLPLDKKGQLTSQARWVKKLAQQFARESGQKVDFVDEYLTTWQAEENLNRRELSKKEPGNSGDRKGKLDQEAARVILEEYIKEKGMKKGNKEGK